MNALTVLSLAAVAACSGAQLPWYPGLYGAYPGLQSWYGSGLPLMPQPTMKALTVEPVNIQNVAPAPLAYNMAPANLAYNMAPANLAYNMAPFASVAPIHSQYNAQDEFGQYSFGYNGGFNARAEMRDAFGNVRGSYNYLDSNGKVQTQHYVADALGFRVEGTNLPEAAAPAYLDYAPDVAAARAEHLAAHEAAAAPAPAPEPKYLDYTKEVADARAAHEAAHAEAAVAAAPAPETRKRRSVMVASEYNPFLRFSYGFNTPLNYAYPAMMGSALSYAAAPGITAYTGLPGYTYAAAAPAAARDAEMLRVENNPGHAVSYRVD